MGSLDSACTVLAVQARNEYDKTIQETEAPHGSRSVDGVDRGSGPRGSQLYHRLLDSTGVYVLDGFIGLVGVYMPLLCFYFAVLRMLLLCFGIYVGWFRDVP